MPTPVPVPVLAAYAIEGGSLLVLGRLYVENLSTHDLGYAAQSDVVSVTRTVISLADGTSIISGPTSLTVSSVILATPSSGNVWTADNLKFNVRDLVDSTLFETLPGVELRYIFTLTGGVAVPLAIQVNLKPA